MDIHKDLELKLEIERLNEKFINTWLPADPVEHTPDKFQYDVKSYCILAHAAFEEYMEKISLDLSTRIEGEWLNKKISKSALCLVMSYSKCTLNIEADELNVQKKTFDQIRNNFSLAVAEHSKAIFNNHGFSKKYLRTILTPVGMDVPNDPKLMSSLSELAEARGSFAHTRAIDAVVPKAKKPLVPEDAAKIVNDCYELCIQIKRSAEKEMGLSSAKPIKNKLRENLIEMKKKNRRFKTRL